MKRQDFLANEDWHAQFEIVESNKITDLKSLVLELKKKKALRSIQ